MNFVVVQFSAESCPTLCDPMGCTTSGFPVPHYLLEFTQTHVRWVADAIQPSHSLSPPSLPAFNLSQHQDLFQWSTLLIRWPKYWNFSLSISPSNSELISSRIDWFDLLAVQETLKSLISTTVQKHQFFVSQPSLSPPLTSVGEGNGNPLQYSCLENPRDRSLVGCCLWGHAESDMTDVT